MALALVTFVLIFLGGGLASDVFGKIGLGETAATIWRIARWPAALLVGDADLRDRLLRGARTSRCATSAGSRRARSSGVLLWILASAAVLLLRLELLVVLGDLRRVRGRVILLVWLWVTNLALLFGAELNAVVDLRRAKYLPESYDGPVLPAKEPAEA